MRRTVTVFFALLALALPTFAQQQPFEEQIEVNAVLLDVIVTDNKGHHILGLGKDDFVVKENGVVQAVDSVDYFTNRRLLDQREEQATFKVERVREDRYFIFFFDKPSAPNLMHDQVTLARESVRKFVREEMKPADVVAIVGHDVRLKVYSDFTNDKAQLERALNEATRFGRGLTTAPAGDGPSILRNMSSKELVNATGTVYQALDLLADSTRSIRARKNLVLFSPGIADRDENVFAGEMLGNRSRHLDPALQSLNAANVSVYGVQLQRNAPGTSLFHQRLGEISDSTGGRYFQQNVSFEPAIEEIENVNSGYYLVTYRSRQARGKNGFQKVDVRLRNPEFKVVARSGYTPGS
ncbi:MAG TPA: VWA domain-containing protein [Thermoanaerobaculia bacterium]|jgi:VWFA-related protein|nr:VWA domain-containing protein [Thermoanaerobaculia bacterium]